MPFNLDAVAAEAEGNLEPFSFVFGGDTYVFPPAIDFRVADALSKGDVNDALRRLLGPDQWECIEASPALLSVDRLKALLEAYMSHIGLDMGEASASTDS